MTLVQENIILVVDKITGQFAWAVIFLWFYKGGVLVIKGFYNCFTSDKTNF